MHRSARRAAGVALLVGLALTGCAPGARSAPTGSVSAVSTADELCALVPLAAAQAAVRVRPPLARRQPEGASGQLMCSYSAAAGSGGVSLLVYVSDVGDSLIQSAVQQSGARPTRIRVAGHAGRAIPGVVEVDAGSRAIMVTAPASTPLPPMEALLGLFVPKLS